MKLLTNEKQKSHENVKNYQKKFDENIKKGFL